MPKIIFVGQDDESEIVCDAPLGVSVLEVARSNNVDLEGACEGSLACSTCHVIVLEEERYECLPEPTEDEESMLDLAFGLTLTSRLGCQLRITEDMDGIRLRIPRGS